MTDTGGGGGGGGSVRVSATPVREFLTFLLLTAREDKPWKGLCGVLSFLIKAEQLVRIARM